MSEWQGDGRRRIVLKGLVAIDMEIRFSIPCVPVAQPRQRHRVITVGGHAMATNYTPTKHPVTVFKAACKIASHAAYSGPPLNGPLLASLTFVMPRPQSMIWKTKPMPRVPCLKKPDLDNLTKAVLDAMIGLAIVDDAMIFSLHLEKWIASGDEQPHVEVMVRAIE